MPSRLPYVLVVFLIITSPIQGLAQDLESKTAKPLFSFKTDDREPLFGERFQFKAGYKIWVAHWQAPIGAGTGNVNQLNSDHPSAMNGPSIAARFKLRDGEWFNSLIAGGSWLRAGFDFHESSTLHSFPIRNDYNGTLGLAVYEGFGLFTGYYLSDQKFANVTPTGTTHSTRTIQGPLFGGFATVPVSEHVSFYGNLAYAILNFRASSIGNFAFGTDSAHGWMNEVGFNFTGPRVANIGTELQAGFRTQIIRKTFGSNVSGTQQGQVGNDITYGPIFTINAVF
jgi:hypothetical protein